ncbi:Uncharacterized protein APZ42_031386, partial [Daphnia magna]
MTTNWHVEGKIRKTSFEEVLALEFAGYVGFTRGFYDEQYEEDNYNDDDDDEEDVIYIDIGEILNRPNETEPSIEMERDDENENAQRDDGAGSDISDVEPHIKLPRNVRYTCNTLNLIATVNVNKILNQRFAKLKKHLDANRCAISNKQSRSSLAFSKVKQKWSDNVNSHHQKAVFNNFQTLLDSGVRTYSLWKELEGLIPKGVFRRHRNPEPFPEQKTHRPERRRVASIKDKKTQLEALARVRASHTAVIVAAQKTAQEAELKAKPIIEESQIKKEREKLRIREQALAKATQRPMDQTPPPEAQPGISKILSPRPQTLLERINQEIKAQSLPKPTPITNWCCVVKSNQCHQSVKSNLI